MPFLARDSPDEQHERARRVDAVTLEDRDGSGRRPVLRQVDAVVNDPDASVGTP